MEELVSPVSDGESIQDRMLKMYKMMEPNYSEMKTVDPSDYLLKPEQSHRIIKSWVEIFGDNTSFFWVQYGPSTEEAA